jgi:hypothetical protein
MSAEERIKGSMEIVSPVPSNALTLHCAPFSKAIALDILSASRRESPISGALKAQRII